ncbi:hypothetical protein M407DRAFT_245097 [Tulasnella calospora MUT 4182]|uniref:Uncharacterized protein n=1 Tax=Tulasnella calospora MUT 4182 TaxID=1051891 RepID=A0A0C3KMJ6_9AGAM|nr:hypothetical protein M407DRAFT_245097 [Tulasnella calospora MUT 4182]
MTLPSANSSSPPTPSMSSSPPRGAVNAKIIDPAELLSADLDSWANLRSTSSRPTTAGGSSSIRSVILGEDGSASGAVVVPPPPASIGRRMRQMSLSDGTGTGR